jgi:hypothetical protein
MKNDIGCLKFQGAETATSSNVERKFSFKNLHEIWQSFVKILLADPKELQVSKKVDRHGNIYWEAYDPVTGKSFSSGSEADISMWIEQLYRY